MLDLSIIGTRFGRLTVLGRSEAFNKRGVRLWRCECDCGNTKNIPRSELVNGHTSSCGCLRNTADSLSHKRPYRIWRSMMNRCYRKYNHNYCDYGGRGIVVCKEWQTFKGFWNDMSTGYNDDLSIDRLDNNKGYYKKNCKWSTPKEQANHRRNSRLFTIDGKTLNVTQWCEKYGLDRRLVFRRLWSGWSIKRSLNIHD